eukprot:g10877.t1 g10877   contig40:18354-19718(+)
MMKVKASNLCSWLLLLSTSSPNIIAAASKFSSTLSVAFQARRGIHIIQRRENLHQSLCFASFGVRSPSRTSPHTFASRLPRRFSSIADTISINMSASNNNGDNNDALSGLSDIGRSVKSNHNSNANDDSMNWKQRIDISIARSRKIRASNYVQISTVDYETMEPRCRTVVFRGFMKGVPSDVNETLAKTTDNAVGHTSNGYQDCVMKMITDRRSNKVKELQLFQSVVECKTASASTAEMVWWFPKSSEQYRIRGRLQFIGSDGPIISYNQHPDSNANKNAYFIAERKQQWGNLSDMAREQFYWDNPGIPYSTNGGNESTIPVGGRDADGNVIQPPPETFLLMLLYPTNVDYLRLGDNYRQLDEWDESDDKCHWSSLRTNP